MTDKKLEFEVPEALRVEVPAEEASEPIALIVPDAPPAPLICVNPGPMREEPPAVPLAPPLPVRVNPASPNLHEPSDRDEE